jgi:hypothetical protein
MIDQYLSAFGDMYVADKVVLGGFQMVAVTDLLADSTGGRASVVGWVLLVVAIGIGLFAVVITTTAGLGNFFDWLARLAPPRSPMRWSMLLGGLALIALAFIFQSWGLAILGAISIFCFWRIYERV